jgi:FixJ family two-component response regulator
MHTANQNLVLVVDDDPGMLRSVARLLRQFGYASLLFPSAEALQTILISATRFAGFLTSTWVMGQASN